MIPLNALKAINYLLQDVMQNKLLFGGIPIVLGGDFRQTPPVVQKGNRIKVVEASIKMFVDKHFKKINLTKNMRADSNAKQFAEWLLKIGNGKEKIYKEFGDNLIKLPQQCISKSKNEFIEQIFGNINSLEELKDTVCLSTTNEIVRSLNKEIQDRVIPGAAINKIR